MAGAQSSIAFERLHPHVQKWIWQQNWTELRDAQERAIEPILRGDTDVIIAATTASGKTEAAFLPIASSLASAQDQRALVVYISPLKALINDQLGRLGPFFEYLGLPAFAWHGDISGTVKKRFRNDGRGVLLITPESLEGMFVLNGHHVHHIFRYLQYTVVDELHSFIGTERGKQLQSLLHRLEVAVGRRIPRIGLSATLGDLTLAGEYLRPDGAHTVQIIDSHTGGQELKLLVRGYEEVFEAPAESSADDTGDNETNESGIATRRIADDLFKVLRGTKNLVFANSRREVESYADLLRTHCEHENLPVEFWPHHGSLSKDIREHVETTLRDKSRPSTAICTSTLELGIDIGSVKSVAQIGSPFSVASLRQRLGRSGRRNEPAILRIYVVEEPITPRTAPVDAIRAELVQSIALVQLLLAKWCEPPESAGLHLSTLVHQVLSLIAEKGGIHASEAWRLLCRDGVFRSVTTSRFAELLRGLGEAGLLMQASDGILLHAPAGERIVNHYTFYTVFQTSEEYRIITENGKSLGTLPVDYPLQAKMLIIFAGRRWRVIHVDERQKVIQVEKASGGKVPRFSGAGGHIHDRVRQEMRSIYLESKTRAYLDTRAADLLAEGRQHFYEFGLDRRHIVSADGSAFLFLWTGDRIANTVALQLQSLGLPVQNHGLAIEVGGVSPADLERRLQLLLQSGPCDAIALARAVPNKQIEKYHPYLTEDLLCIDYAASALDPTSAWRALAATVAGRAI